MTAVGHLVVGLLAVLAVAVQVAVLARLPLPGGPPDVLLVVTVAVGLLAGSRSATLAGFGLGLLADLASAHELGRLALAYAVVGFVAGRVHDDVVDVDVDPGPVLPVLAVSGGAVLAVFVYAGEAVLLGAALPSSQVFLAALAGTVAYSALLAPVVVPIVAALRRWLTADRRL